MLSRVYLALANGLSCQSTQSQRATLGLGCQRHPCLHKPDCALSRTQHHSAQWPIKPDWPATQLIATSLPHESNTYPGPRRGYRHLHTRYRPVRTQTVHAHAGTRGEHRTQLTKKPPVLSGESTDPLPNLTTSTNLACSLTTMMLPHPKHGRTPESTARWGPLSPYHA